MQTAFVIFAIFATCNAISLRKTFSSINATGCGIPTQDSANKQFMARIYNGFNARVGGYPWMAYVYAKDNGHVDGYLCGGTLISTEYIVTAAHCIVEPDSPESYRIVLGEHKASSRSGIERDHRVSEIIVHEDYDPKTMVNDIALIRVEKPVAFSSHILPVCLPDQDFPTDADVKTLHQGEYLSYAGRHCTVLGWSTTETKWKSDILQQQDVTIFPRVLCSPLTSQAESYVSFVEEDEKRFCAGGVMGEDSCNVNGGGPLLCQADDGRYHLLGVTSYGPEPCGQALLPGVFTEVSKYRDWMDANME